MRNTSARNGGVVAIARAACLWLAPLLLFGGCSELVHFGQVSDRDSAWEIGDVKIEQQHNDGTWQQLGRTDGKGRFSILKSEIRGGGRIRISKPGYHTVVMAENEFLQQNNILIVPSDTQNSSDFGNL